MASKSEHWQKKPSLTGDWLLETRAGVLQCPVCRPSRRAGEGRGAATDQRRPPEDDGLVGAAADHEEALLVLEEAHRRDGGAVVV